MEACGTFNQEGKCMWNNFLISLEIMAKGMAGIFVVIGILTLAVMLMGKWSQKDENKDQV